MPKQRTVRLELTPRAKDAFDAASSQTGMTQYSLGSRIVEWFARQTPAVQGMVLGLYPEDMRAEIAALMLQRGLDKPGTTGRKR